MKHATDRNDGAIENAGDILADAWRCVPNVLESTIRIHEPDTLRSLLDDFAAKQSRGVITADDKQAEEYEELVALLNALDTGSRIVFRNMWRTVLEATPSRFPDTNRSRRDVIGVLASMPEPALPKKPQREHSYRTHERPSDAEKKAAARAQARGNTQMKKRTSAPPVPLTPEEQLAQRRFINNIHTIAQESRRALERTLHEAEEMADRILSGEHSLYEGFLDIISVHHGGSDELLAARLRSMLAGDTQKNQAKLIDAAQRVEQVRLSCISSMGMLMEEAFKTHPSLDVTDLRPLHAVMNFALGKELQWIEDDEYDD